MKTLKALLLVIFLAGNANMSLQAKEENRNLLGGICLQVNYENREPVDSVWVEVYDSARKYLGKYEVGTFMGFVQITDTVLFRNAGVYHLVIGKPGYRAVEVKYKAVSDNESRAPIAVLVPERNLGIEMFIAGAIVNETEECNRMRGVLRNTSVGEEPGVPRLGGIGYCWHAACALLYAGKVFLLASGGIALWHPGSKCSIGRHSVISFGYVCCGGMGCRRTAGRYPASFVSPSLWQRTLFDRESNRAFCSFVSGSCLGGIAFAGVACCDGWIAF